MGFSIGIGELTLVGCLAICTVVLAVFGLRFWHWSAAALCGTVVGSLLTPADPASTVVLAAVCCLFFAGGVRSGRSLKVARP